MTHNANEIHLILSEIGAENHAKNEEIVESGYCFVTLNATINLILIESAVQFWRLHSNRKWTNYAKLPGNIVGRDFFWGGRKIDWTSFGTTLYVYMPGNNTTNLFFFFENSICTIVYLILMLFFVCLSSRNTCAPLRTHTCTHMYTHFVMRLQVTTQMIQSALRKWSDAMVIVHDLSLFSLCSSERCVHNILYSVFIVVILLCLVFFPHHYYLVPSQKEFQNNICRERERGAESDVNAFDIHNKEAKQWRWSERKQDRERERIKKKGKRKITLKNALLNVIEFM